MSASHLLGLQGMQCTPAFSELFLTLLSEIYLHKIEFIDAKAIDKS